ncbi:uncharacterized protein PHALS_02493 [Plasmopara halstedii]|uniref:Uncharacterized protein n=1 Tax=Plasmopara halstedii TaxID=4781 RepID=A0A0P1A7D3_PLAHL|nr:uncharacterized protein PHALS_02493 [Plasmopara halstedii]CEG36393.1 hypothetical protein PHALS_02493 [Plasmopara halstedii]|eukprot:XP_024572762.1 hypothetical protein PHALS_02493 [Plasmopara halstedii]
MQTVDSVMPLTKPLRRIDPLKPLVTRETESSRHQDETTSLTNNHQRMNIVIGSKSSGKAACFLKSGAASQKYVVKSHGVRKRLNSIDTSQRSSSIVSRKKLAIQIPTDFHTIDDQHKDSGISNEDRESDSDNDVDVQGASDYRHRTQFFKSLVGPTTYEDGKVVYQGHVDHRGMTPHVTFATIQTPPSVIKSACSQPVTCSFCSSTNLTWILRCAFCGSARMSDAPRLKYLLDMILSIDPMIKPDKLAKRILDYAKFDRVALKAEAALKQAGLMRAKAAIMMMNRTVLTLRFQIMRMVFVAWKKAKAVSIREHAIIGHVLAIKEAQTRRKCRQIVFSSWKGHVARVVDERVQRFQVALKRNEGTKVRQILSNWRSHLYIRGKEKIEEVRCYFEKELRDTPLEAQKEIYRLKDVQQEIIKLIFTTGDLLMEFMHNSLEKADHCVLKTLQLVQMYPTTAGEFFQSAHGNELLNTLSSGHAMPQIDEFGLNDVKDYEMIRQLLAQTIEKVEKFAPSDSLIYWLNFQRRRGAEMGTTIDSTSYQEDDVFVQRRSRASSMIKPLRIRTKDKKKEIKPIKALQDLKTVLSNPGVMLKLLCHTSFDAQQEYDRFQSSETATYVAVETSSIATTLSPSAQAQLRAYFKIIPRVLNLPPDIITRDSFVLNDFDSLYAYAVYLFLFHPNYVAPGMTLTSRYQIKHFSLTTQWQKVKTSLQDNECDTFSQQQFHIFLSKLKRTHKQYFQFINICNAVGEIASCHERFVAQEAFNEFSRRVLCKDSKISVSLEKETLASCISLPTAKLLSLCEDMEELRRIEQVYKANVLDLIKIFRLYGTAAGGKGILEQEFLKVMTKAGVTNKKNILRSTLQIIYQQSRNGNSSEYLNSGAFSLAEGDDESEDRGASPNEFFEALTRVAYHNYQKRREFIGQLDLMGDEVCVDDQAGNCTLLSCVLDLVVEKVIPLTRKSQEQGLTFKKQMIYPDVQHVCKAQEKKLKRTKDSLMHFFHMEKLSNWLLLSNKMETLEIPDPLLVMDTKSRMSLCIQNL